MRTLLLASIIPLFAAGCCSDDNWLRRIEVWKQQELFTPAQPVIMAPQCCPQAAPCAPEPTCGMAVEPTCGMTVPMAVEPTCGMMAPMAGGPSLGQPISQTVGSPEVIDGVLEQP